MIDIDAETGAPLLRTSERNDFKRCPWLWKQTWLEGLRPRRSPTWSWFGTAIHRGLEARYPVGDKRGSLADMIDAFEESLGDEVRKIYTVTGEDMDETEKVEATELGIAMLRGYVAHYGEDSHWTVLHTEQPFQINVPHPNKKKGVLVVYAGTWDLAIFDKIEKVYKIVDHKTRKQFPRDWSFYNINDQAGSYLWVAREVLIHKGILKKSDSIEGLVFNALRKALPDTRPRDALGQATNLPTKDHYLKALQEAGVPTAAKPTVADLKNLAASIGLEVLGEVSKVQPSPLFHREEVFRSPSERVRQAKRVQAEALAMNAMRKGKIPFYKTPTEDCTRCPIFEMCELDEQNPEEAKEYADTVYIRTDPYRDHRAAMETGGLEL